MGLLKFAAKLAGSAVLTAAGVASAAVEYLGNMAGVDLDLASDLKENSFDAVKKIWDQDGYERKLEERIEKDETGESDLKKLNQKISARRSAASMMLNMMKKYEAYGVEDKYEEYRERYEEIRYDIKELEREREELEREVKENKRNYQMVEQEFEENTEENIENAEEDKITLDDLDDLDEQDKIEE